MGFFLKVVGLISVLLFLFCFSVIRAVDCGNPTHVAYEITVDKSGKGNFKKIQDAIDSVKPWNNQWVRISLRPGIYRERVRVGWEKTCILLEGQSSKTTSIEFDARHPYTNETPTFTLEADNFVAKQISFKNTRNLDSKGKVDKNNMAPAIAAAVIGNKAAFYDCGFYGYQDTLWDVVGRHYFQNCEIAGAVDFIWGNGQSLYKNCHIVVNGNGYITAQGRSLPNQTSGFVFENGWIDGNGSALLGRAYGKFSRVIFYKTKFSGVIDPKGWDSWDKGNHKQWLTYAEYNCEGEGADTSKRVKWLKRPEDVESFIQYHINDTKKWLSNQP